MYQLTKIQWIFYSFQFFLTNVSISLTNGIFVLNLLLFRLFYRRIKFTYNLPEKHYLCKRKNRLADFDATLVNRS